MPDKTDDLTDGMDAGQRRVHLHQVSGWLWLIGLPGCMAIGAFVFAIKLQFGATYSAIFDLGLFFVLGITLEVKLYARLKRWQIALGPDGTWMDRALRGRLELLRIEAHLERNADLAAARGCPKLRSYFVIARLAGYWGELALVGVMVLVVLCQQFIEPMWICQMVGVPFVLFRIWLMQHCANHQMWAQVDRLSPSDLDGLDGLGGRSETEQEHALRDVEARISDRFQLLNPFGATRTA